MQGQRSSLTLQSYIAKVSITVREVPSSGNLTPESYYLLLSSKVEMKNT